MSISAPPPILPRGRHYLAIFLLSLSVLMLEIVFARVLSVALFSHYAFVAVSLAMFGLGLSSLTVYLMPGHFTAERLDEQLVTYSWRFALSTVLSLIVFLRFQVVQELSLSGFLTLSFAYVILAIPFFFAGVCLALLMTHFAAQIGRIYAADLVGASLGCVGVVAAMSMAPGPHVVAGVAVLVAVTALGLALVTTPRRLVGPVTALTVAIVALGLGLSTDLLRMKYIKNWKTYYSGHEAWNAFSRISTFASPQDAVSTAGLKTDYWKSADAPPRTITVDIDGAAWTPIVEFDGDFRRVAFLRDSVLYVAHQLRQNADVLIIGTGGGRDLLAAATFEQKSVLGIEINPLMRHMVQDVHGDFSGRPYTLPTVQVIIDEARSRLSTLDRRFDVIQLSLIDTFSLNAAGGFVFSENYLYTTEGFQEYFRHLTDEGMLSISRYFNPAYPLEVLRVAAMTRAAWHAEGVPRASDHVVVFGGELTATLLAKRTPFTAAELERLDVLTKANAMQVHYRPDRHAESHPDLTAVLTTEDLSAFVDAHPFVIAPPTDDQPFFFNFLRGRLAPADIADHFKDPFQFLRKWNDAILLLYLLIAVVTTLAVTFFLGPLLLLGRRSKPVGVAVAIPLLAYFACLGYGFMMIEIPLLQHFVLFLGYPVYSLVVVLFSLLLFSGIGSLLSSRFDSAPSAVLTRVLLAIVSLAIAYVYVVPMVINLLIGAALWLRILATVVLLAPIGTLLGMAYPLGITVLRGIDPQLVPWAWSLNGVLSVVASVFAIFIGSRVGFSIAFLTGVWAYAIALVAMRLAVSASGSSRAVGELAARRSVAAN